MNILIAPDKFKGTLTAKQAAQCMKSGIRLTLPRAKITMNPLADGGEGTLDVLVYELGGERISKQVTGPYGQRLIAVFQILPTVKGKPKTAVIEMALASGLNLVGRIKKPLSATTYGTGELIKFALEEGCKKIIIGLGGSATTDGGIGALGALGMRFLNRKGIPVGTGGILNIDILSAILKIDILSAMPYVKGIIELLKEKEIERLKKVPVLYSGKHLSEIHSVDESRLDKRALKAKFVLAVDVDNPLWGPYGAARIYAKQKGANRIQIKKLDAGLKHFADFIKEKKDIDLQEIPGSAAAGGLAGGLKAFLPNVKIQQGFEFISSCLNLEQKVKDADLIITGEGRIDLQTARGKAPYGILKLAQKYEKKVVVLAGSAGKGWEVALEKGFDRIYTLDGRNLAMVTKPVAVTSFIRDECQKVKKMASVIAKLETKKRR